MLTPRPTQVTGPTPSTSAYLAGHDDYDCVDDLVSAGLVKVVMPTADPITDTYVTSDGRACLVGDVVIRPSFPSPMSATLLARYADFIPTPKGSFIATVLTG
jgi:hypothetical protein